LFISLFQNQQPVLEAGCGSGRWNGWFYKNGISSHGTDWSSELCARAQKYLPACHFYVCDLRSIPVASKTYGGIIALGSIEHSKVGPFEILREFHRLLKNDGVAVITVPYGSTFRKLRMFLIDAPLLRLRSVKIIRKAFNKHTDGTSLSEARNGTIKAWWPRFSNNKQGWYFYEYEFNKKQMRTFLKQCGFDILEESVICRDDGIYHNFRPLFARWNREEEVFSFSTLGNILREMLPVEWIGHMLCYVVKKV
jgi:SAM-dependent methyltransferase